MGLQELLHRTFAHVAARTRSRYASRASRRARLSPGRIIKPISLLRSDFILDAA